MTLSPRREQERDWQRRACTLFNSDSEPLEGSKHSRDPRIHKANPLEWPLLDLGVINRPEPLTSQHQVNPFQSPAHAADRHPLNVSFADDFGRSGWDVEQLTPRRD